jgi:hypothetical protein
MNAVILVRCPNTVTLQKYRNKRNRKNDKTRVRYAAVGLGHISQDATLPAFFNARKNSEVCALVTEDPVKARRLSKQYDVPLFYPCPVP